MGEHKRRVLGRIRLSRLTDESTSEARQREAIGQYAAMHGHEIVGWAVDLDVSGAVSPFETPELGAWLAQPDTFDVLVSQKLDRLSRTLFETNALFKWCQDHGKTLACIEDQIDLSTWTGRLVASVIAGVAEGELEAIKSRTSASQQKIRELGRWHGGTVPYGYAAVQRGGGWYLDVDPTTSDVVREIVRRVVDHDSLRGIADDLTSRGIPAPRGGAWGPNTLNRMVRGRWIIGQAQHGGRVVTGDDGMPLQRAEPLISFKAWQLANSTMSERSRPRRNQYPTGVLTGVAFCAECGASLYHVVMDKVATRGKVYRYWRCSGPAKMRNGCTARAPRADDLEGFVADQVLQDIGHLERTERVYVPGDDNSDALAQITSAIEVARRERDAGLYDGDDDAYLARITGLIERRKAIESQPSQPAGWVVKGLGETYAEAWQRDDNPEYRRSVLLDGGITVHAAARMTDDSGSVVGPVYRFVVPHDLRGRLQRTTGT